MPNKDPKSTRLQMKVLRENHPKDFEKAGHCVVFFIDEMKYSLIELRNIDPTQEVEVMAMVAVNHGQKKYMAKVLCIGTEEECTKRLNILLKDQSDIEDDKAAEEPVSKRRGKKPQDKIDKDVEDELTKIKKVASLAKSQVALSSSDDEDDDDSASEGDYDHTDKKMAHAKARLISSCGSEAELHKKLDLILSKLTNIESKLEVRKRPAAISPHGLEETPPPSVKKPKLERSDDHASACGSEFTASSSLMYRNTNLLSISSGGDIKKFSLKVFGTLFSKDEMIVGVIDPNKKALNNGKVALDTEKVHLLKSAITQKFGEETFHRKWDKIRQSCNQKCLDTKNKQKE